MCWLWLGFGVCLFVCFCCFDLNWFAFPCLLVLFMVVWFRFICFGLITLLVLDVCIGCCDGCAGPFACFYVLVFDLLWVRWGVC